MRMLSILVLLATLTIGTRAHASTFTISHENRAAVDPAQNFEADCLGTTEAADCSNRAAALSAELVELLSSLEGRRDVDSIALFQLDGRPSYDNYLPAAGPDDGWAASQARDALLEAMLAFEESEQFTPATRLLMNDRVLMGFSDPTGELPVTGFVTDSSVAEVTAFFTRLFGKAPYASLVESEAKLQALNEELEGLQVKVSAGDRAAVERLLEVAEELTPLQAAVSLASLYEFEEQQCADHVFWVDGDPENLYGGAVPRAVAIGQDRLIGRTAIRYVNGQRKGAPPPSDDGPDADGGPNDDDASDKPGKGGGCSTHGASSGGPWFLGVGVLLAALLRRRRQRPIAS